jgi:hypothetical protein
MDFTMPTPANLIASVLFGIIGFAAFMYGKKSMKWKAMSIGFILMAYPYAVSQTWLMYLIGCALCAALFVFRDD